MQNPFLMLKFQVQVKGHVKIKMAFLKIELFNYFL